MQYKLYKSVFREIFKIDNQEIDNKKSITRGTEAPETDQIIIFI